MTYEIVPGMSGFGAYGSGYGSFGGAGDLLGESCLCGPSGSCSNAKLQGPAMAQLRAAMSAAGLSPSSGVWKQAEANQMNVLAAASGQPTSSFLTSGGPCRALKAKLAAPAPQPGGGTTTTGGVTCASLLSQAPPIPSGTPIDAVIAVLQQLAPPGFDVRACVANTAPPSPMPNTTIPLPGQDTLPPGPAGGSVTTGGDTSGLSPLVILGIGLVAVMGVGGIAFVALSPKMRKNGKRSRMRKNGGKIGGEWSSSRSSWFAMGERVGKNALPKIRASIPRYLPPGAGTLREIADAKAYACAVEVGEGQSRLTRMSGTQLNAYRQGVYATIMRDIVPSARPRKAF